MLLARVAWPLRWQHRFGSKPRSCWRLPQTLECALHLHVQAINIDVIRCNGDFLSAVVSVQFWPVPILRLSTANLLRLDSRDICNYSDVVWWCYWEFCFLRGAVVAALNTLFSHEQTNRQQWQ